MVVVAASLACYPEGVAVCEIDESQCRVVEGLQVLNGRADGGLDRDGDTAGDGCRLRRPDGCQDFVSGADADLDQEVALHVERPGVDVAQDLA
jgi:hypothetical protein